MEPWTPPVIYIRLLNDLAKVPTRGSEYAAGYDLYAATDYAIDIAPHSTVKIGTGVAIELEPYTFGAIFARSGLATKKVFAQPIALEFVMQIIEENT